MKNPTQAELDGYVGRHISEICGCGYTSDGENHCAHFVCHITELNFGTNCFTMTDKGSRKTSANIRVQEVFPRCRRVGKWANKPQDIRSGFIFVTKEGNVDTAKKQIVNVPQKHIGIFIEQNVWQYKNLLKHVIRQTPAEFKQHYAGDGFEIFYGEFPL